MNPGPEQTPSTVSRRDFLKLGITVTAVTSVSMMPPITPVISSSTNPCIADQNSATMPNILRARHRANARKI